MRNLKNILISALKSNPNVARTLKYIIIILIVLLYCVYLIFALKHRIDPVLITFTSLFIAFSIFKALECYFGREILLEVLARVLTLPLTLKIKTASKWLILLVTVATLVYYIICDALISPKNLISLGGIFVFVVLCFMLSSNQHKIKWKVILLGIIVQSVMGLAIMRSRAVYDAITFISNQITGYLNHAQKGAIFIFGEKYWEHELLMGVVAVSVFFNATTYSLYHLNIVQVVIRIIGHLFSIVLPVSPVECFSAISNIFFGPDATIMMVKPMMPRLTVSQLHSLVSAGMASIDVGMIPIFQSLGIPANHLLSASFMSAPAAVVFSKIVKPERHRAVHALTFDQTEHSNLLEAFQQGSYDAITFSASILSVLLSYVSLLEAANCTVEWFGDRIGVQNLTLQVLMAYLFYPLVFLMGVDEEDCLEVAKLVGVKTIINEFVAYEHLSKLIENRKKNTTPFISIRSETIASYALCGYSNIGTIGTMIGFIAAIAPTRKHDVTKMAVSCLIASSFACFSTACTAALFYRENES